MTDKLILEVIDKLKATPKYGMVATIYVLVAVVFGLLFWVLNSCPDGKIIRGLVQPYCVVDGVMEGIFWKD